MPNDFDDIPYDEKYFESEVDAEDSAFYKQASATGRILQEKIKELAMNARKKNNDVIGKHYVGAKAMIECANSWYNKKGTFEDAVAHAKHLMTKEPIVDRMIIVKVVAIVEKETPPFKVRMK